MDWCHPMFHTHWGEKVLSLVWKGCKTMIHVVNSLPQTVTCICSWESHAGLLNHIQQSSLSQWAAVPFGKARLLCWVITPILTKILRPCNMLRSSARHRTDMPSSFQKLSAGKIFSKISRDQTSRHQSQIQEDLWLHLEVTCGITDNITYSSPLSVIRQHRLVTFFPLF